MPIDGEELLSWLMDEMFVGPKWIPEEHEYAWTAAMDEVRKHIEEMDEAVIRCGECKFASKTSLCWCRKMETVRDPDWYCADGIWEGEVDATD